MQISSTINIAAFVVFFLLGLGYKQSETFFPNEQTTEVIIIGTVHFDSDKFNSDTLLKIFEKIKPDLILVESDSTYFTGDFELSEDIKNEFPETQAITKYKKNNTVLLRPYDIPGRDSFMNDYKRTEIKRNLFNDIYYLKSNKYSGDTSAKWTGFERLLRVSAQMSDSGLTYINSEEGSNKVDTINSDTYEGIRDLINSVPELGVYKDFWKEEIDFWNKRNGVMLKNILQNTKRFSGKRIIVLCGFAHKNYLKKNARYKGFENYFIMKEFWEY